MIRIRWFDSESDDPSIPVDWPASAAILATLFLNIFVWLEFCGGFWQFYPLPRFAILMAAVAVVVAGLFFMGPMLLAHRYKRPLFGVIEDSLGRIPALALRVCAGLFLVLWIGYCTSILQFLWNRGFLRAVSGTEETAVSAVMLLFLLATSMQSLRTEAKLASFTVQVAIVILIAALLRVPDGWSAIFDGFYLPGDRSGLAEAWRGFSDLTWLVAPMGVFAAEFGYRSRRRRDVAMVGLMGVVLPLFVSLLMAAVIGVAVRYSNLYQPSLRANIGMALWGHAAISELQPRMIVIAVTMFGVMRFSIRSLAQCASIRRPITVWRWTLLGGILIAAVVISVMHLPLHKASGITVRCVAATGAVLTGDYLMGRQRAPARRWLDWGGCLALLVGLATPLYYLYWSPELTEPQTIYPWGIHSYLVALVACVVIRGVGRVRLLVRTAPLL